MPYIEQGKRPPIDKIIDPLIDHLKNLPMEEQDGAFNYAITRVLKGLYENPKRYFKFNRALGVLEAVKQEFYRRDVGPYEDEKIVQNGDVK